MRKKIILISTLFSIILASCDKVTYNTETLQKEPVVLSAEFSDVDISSMSQKQTRAEELTNETISNFGVYAYYDEDGSFDNALSVPNFLNNVKATKVSSEWVYNPLMYWPANGALSFFAYAPYELTGNNSISVSSSGMPVFTYAQSNDVKQQIDLLFSYPMINKTRADINSENKLPLKFKHALSSVVFKAYVMSPFTEVVKVTSIELQGICGKREAMFTSVPVDETYPEGWRLIWSNVNGAADNNYVLSLNNGCLLDKDIKTNTSAVDITATDGHLMLIPQDIDDIDKIIVKSTIHNTPKAASLKALIPTFETGKRYIISIKVISKVDLDITCTVVPWEPKSIDVPEFN